MSKAQQTRPKVLAAIPCFNTEPFIVNVVSNTKKYVDQAVVINDGSHDDTAEAARTSGALVINHGASRGYEEAIKSCFEAARRQTPVLLWLPSMAMHSISQIKSQS